MQLVAMIDPFSRIEVEPALPACGARARIPADRQGLQATTRQLNQILLQGLDAKRVLDLEIGKLAVGPVGAHEESIVAAKKTRGHSGIREARISKIAEHRRIRGVLHGAGVLRGLPRGMLGCMTTRAGGTADEGRRLGRQIVAHE